MITNLIKVAFRNFFREKFYTLLNVVGLAVGIAVSMLIGIYILNELSYDRFHSKADRIYRLISHLEMGSNSFDGNAVFPPLGATLKDNLPEVEYSVRISQPADLLVKVEDIAFFEQNIYFVDPDFFEVFDFKLLAGDPATAIAKRYQVVLTPTLAQKYFQSSDWSSIVGKSILMGDDLYLVTGIVEETPSNAHFHYSAIGSIESTRIGRQRDWDSMNTSTYLLLNEGASVSALVAKFPELIEKQNPGFLDLPKQGINLSFSSQPLTSIHLHSNVQGEFEPNGDIVTLYIFAIVAMVVLLLACVNFINLTTARSANRAKEVGVRKVLGSGTNQLVRQFMLESTIVVAVSTLIALGFVELARIPFAALTGKELAFGVLLEPTGLGLLLVFVVLLGLFAGSYPSFFMAGLKPSLVLKGDIRSGFKSSKLRNGLVMLQFTISIVLIISTLMVQKQLDYMRSKKLGFDKENVVVLSNADRLDSQEAFTNGLRQLPGVQIAGSSEYRPFSSYNGTAAVTEEDKENRKLISTALVDYDYATALKLEFIEGRNFSRDFPSDSTGIMLNEVAANYLFEGDPLGKKVYLEIDTTSLALNVIGVIKDFNYQPLKNEVTPLVFVLSKNQPNLYVRLNPGDYKESLTQIETLWNKHADITFDYSFFDDSYNNLFKEESRIGFMFSVFTGLALFIACLGLLGLAAYMSEQRSKEMSIRKVLGATLPQIVVLFSRDLTRLILLSSLLAFPIAYYGMDVWLSTYAYRTPMSASLFIVSSILVLLVAFITISYQSIKAALVNPVESLKNE
jgi:putative ABC transport system permease protein